MNATAAPQGRRILWLNVLTVFSAAILIGAEVFGGAFAAGWAVANLGHLEATTSTSCRASSSCCGVAVMVRFILNARRVEPFTEADGVSVTTSASTAQRARARRFTLCENFLKTRAGYFVLASLSRDQKC